MIERARPSRMSRVADPRAYGWGDEGEGSVLSSWTSAAGSRWTRRASFPTARDARAVVVFADIASPNTSANLERNSAVEVNVVDPLIRRGYRFAGTAVVHRDGASFEVGVQFYENRRTVQARARIRAVVVILITSARTLRSPAYVLGATEAELNAKYRRLLLGDS